MMETVPGAPEDAVPVQGPGRPAQAGSPKDPQDDEYDPSVSDVVAKYQTELRRVLAIFMDVILVVVVSSILWFPLTIVFGRFGYLDPVRLTYPLYMVLSTWMYGKTLGKRICGLEVASWQDQVLALPGSRRISLASSAMREIVPVALAVAAILMLISPDHNERGALPWVELGMGFILSYGTKVWILLEVISMLRDPNRRAFNDKIAGTVVVKKNRLDINRTPVSA